MIRVADNKREENLHAALVEIQKEDPTIVLRYGRETAQHLLGAQGELHLNLLKWKLDHHYKADAVFSSPRIPYSEPSARPPRPATGTRKRPVGAASSVRCT